MKKLAGILNSGNGGGILQSFHERLSSVFPNSAGPLSNVRSRLEAVPIMGEMISKGGIMGNVLGGGSALGASNGQGFLSGGMIDSKLGSWGEKLTIASGQPSLMEKAKTLFTPDFMSSSAPSSSPPASSSSKPAVSKESAFGPGISSPARTIKESNSGNAKFF